MQAATNQETIRLGESGNPSVTRRCRSLFDHGISKYAQGEI